MVVSVGERVHKVDNACRYGDNQNPALDLRGVSWEGFFVCLGVCAKFDFSVFLEINGGSRHERPQRNRSGHTAIYGERVDPKTAFSTMPEIILFGFLCRVTSSMYCGTVPLPP